jgi:predicted TIM-barrel fold metal-dependent hydrolase
MGTDYCFDIAYTEPVQIVERTPGLTDRQREEILGTNAARLLKIPATTS